MGKERLRFFDSLISRAVQCGEKLALERRWAWTIRNAQIHRPLFGLRRTMVVPQLDGPVSSLNSTTKG